MGLELRQSLKLAQRLVMTQQLKQAIRLLQLGRLELSDALRAEIVQNPMLEEIEPGQDKNNDQENPDSLSATEETPAEEAQITGQVEGDSPGGLAEVNWEDYQNNFDCDLKVEREVPSDAPSQFDFISVQPGLADQLCLQLMSLNLNKLDRKITHYIIGNLDRHGYLQTGLSDIAAACGCTEEEAEAALRLVQSLEPAGIGARDLRECLLLQLERQEPEDELALRIVDSHMAQLETKNYAPIAKALGVTVAAVQAAVGRIRALNPYPGNEFDNAETSYVSPDVYVYKVDGEFHIRLNDEGLPNLRLCQEYLDLIKNKKALGSASRAFLQENKRNAIWLIKSVEQRQHTIYRVMESLLKFQRDFFEKGPLYMKPLVLRKVAEDIGMHESTISRVTANKYVHTPEGIYELKYFFNSAVTNTDGSSVGAEAIKARIRQLVGAEDPAHPISDQNLAVMLGKDGIEVARRTVAKYREQLKILPVKHRRVTGRN